MRGEGGGGYLAFRPKKALRTPSGREEGRQHPSHHRSTRTQSDGTFSPGG